MERLSNQYTQLLAEGEKEILAFDPPENGRMIALYSEIPAIIGNPFALSIWEMPDGNFVSKMRIWDRNGDLLKWETGVYNLDRLRIVMETIALSEEQNLMLSDKFFTLSGQQLPSTLSCEGAVIIDGADYHLKIDGFGIRADYVWKSPTPDLALFFPLLEGWKGMHPRVDQWPPRY